MSDTDSKTELRRAQERYQKGLDLKAVGVNPYPYNYAPTHHAADILAKHKGLAAEQKTGETVCVAGRIMLLRSMGKACFGHIQDQSGRIQFYVRADEIGEAAYAVVKKLDMGDIIGVRGEVFATKTAEITVHVSEITILTKSVRDLPDKYHGIKDPEIKYRYRYLDLMINSDVRAVFEKRSKMVAAIRDYFSALKFVEVETPLLQSQYGGANAKPFTTHINAWDMKMYLSISPELYLKRLVVGGFERVFTICKNFRNEGVDHSHNPEFTMLEAYQAYGDYHTMMKITEEVYERAAIAVNGTTKLTVFMRDEKGEAYPVEVDFQAPWPKKTTAELVKEKMNIDILSMSDSDLRRICEDKGLEVGADASWGACVKALFDEFIEHTVIFPTHVIDRPKESSPLCKEHRSDARLIEQCESICAGMELCNIYSELNDPVKQRALLEGQASQLRGGDDEAHPMDDDFIRAIEYGLPPTGGLGIGIDRMAVLLLGQSTIKDVILFPTVKPLAEEPEEKK
ncbi:MAG TPA: lysine--tRNA ligase [Acidobacteriota bacterium]|nr:lysine--tRNA ligase [Acidobacteriota bacterium]